MKSKLLGALLLLLCSPFISLAQTSSAITGTIQDQAGAVIAGAKIIVRSLETNLTRNIVTDEIGRASCRERVSSPV